MDYDSSLSEYTRHKAALVMQLAAYLTRKFAPLRISRKGLYDASDVDSLIGWQQKQPIQPEKQTALLCYNRHRYDYRRWLDEQNKLNRMIEEINPNLKNAITLEEYSHVKNPHEHDLREDRHAADRSDAIRNKFTLDIAPLLSDLDTFQKLVDKLTKPHIGKKIGGAGAGAARSFVKHLRYELKHEAQPQKPPMTRDDLLDLRNNVQRQLQGTVPPQGRQTGNGIGIG